jgi:hypothetical protein
MRRVKSSKRYSGRAMKTRGLLCLIDQSGVPF